MSCSRASRNESRASRAGRTVVASARRLEKSCRKANQPVDLFVMRLGAYRQEHLVLLRGLVSKCLAHIGESLASRLPHFNIRISESRLKEFPEPRKVFHERVGASLDDDAESRDSRLALVWVSSCS